jgi:hypothetical protein
MPAMALGTTTIENIVAHDAAALERTWPPSGRTHP